MNTDKTDTGINNTNKVTHSMLFHALYTACFRATLKYKSISYKSYLKYLLIILIVIIIMTDLM